jgi:SAM-dependent methyltransferase
MKTLAPYIFASIDAGERDRLRLLAQLLDPLHRKALSTTRIGPGLSSLELGAGTGTVSAWIAGTAGPTGQVLATDLNTEFLHQAAHPNVVVEQLDALRDPLPEARFDLITARALLHHLPGWAQVVKKCVAALKPGGSLVLVEPDATTSVLNTDPMHHRFWSAWCRWGGTEGVDYRIGHKLTGVMREAGLEVTDTSIDVPFYQGGSDWATLYAQTVDATMPRAGERIEPDLVEAFQRATVDPSQWLCSFGWVAVTGRRATTKREGGSWCPPRPR